MKSKFLIILLLVLLTPQLVFAVWWNPFTWGGEKMKTPVGYTTPSPVAQSISPRVNTIFYVKQDNTRIRKCPSLECEIVGYFNSNEPITVGDIKKVSLAEMDDWMHFTFPDGKSAYINKSVLSEAPVKITNTNVSNSSLSESDRKAMLAWITAAKKEIRNMESERRYVESEYGSIAFSILDTQEVFLKNISSIEAQMENVYGKAIVAHDASSHLIQFQSLMKRYEEIIAKYLNDKEIALRSDAQRHRNSINSQRLDALKRENRLLQQELDIRNQARIDATNAYVDEYKKIRSEGSQNGATEAVVNAQLEAAGLIRQTHCSFSSVGGMTPGSGSVTCY